MNKQRAAYSTPAFPLTRNPYKENPMDIETNELETKAGIPLDSVMTHGEMMRAFEAFKATNDQRLALTEKRTGDVVVEEKLARINTAIDAQPRRASFFIWRSNNRSYSKFSA